LQPRSGVHDVTRNHPFALFGSGLERHQGFAGVDADPDLEI
jgi:hypothetical protein